MKNKYLSIIFLMTSILTLSSCNKGFSKDTYMSNIDEEIKKTYQYFMDTTNLNTESKGYGLVRDRYTNKSLASIASVGFALASYPIYVEEGYMNKSEATSIVSKTMDTLLTIQNDPSSSYGGCLKHYVSINSGVGTNCEISTIDTAILVSGAIVAGEYFGEEVKTKVYEFWSNVDYNKFAMKKGVQNLISMGANLTLDEENSTYTATLLSGWDFYAEQLMIYIIGAGNPNEANRISDIYYKDITKRYGSYGDGEEYIYSWFGSLFTYQFSHAFYNFDEYLDYKGVNYHENSVNASLAAYEYCQDYSEVYKTFSPTSWGLTACDTPSGYSGELGTPARGFSPSSNYKNVEGTVAPCAAIGSVIFTPELSLKALANYQSISLLNDDSYGLKDAYLISDDGAYWVDADYIGIDKGISTLMLYNYKKDGFIQNLAMQNEDVIEGFLNNGFSKNEQ